MITLEDKLDIFYRIVYKAEEEKIKMELQELEEKQKDILQAKEEELKQIQTMKIERKRTQATSEKNEMISQSIDKSRKKSLVKREELLDNLIETIELKSMKFTENDKYQEYLVKKIKQSLDSIDEKMLTFGLKFDDIKRVQDHIGDIENEYKKTIELKTIDNSIIGGFKIWDQDRSYTLDSTFKTIIEENRYQIGKKLYLALGGAGESDE